jgi:hypothetical protein
VCKCKFTIAAECGRERKADLQVSDDALPWRKAKKSQTGSCVEVAPAPGGLIAVRDSKDPHGGMLLYTPVEWDAFLDGVKRGEFDDLLQP